MVPLLLSRWQGLLVPWCPSQPFLLTCKKSAELTSDRLTFLHYVIILQDYA